MRYSLKMSMVALAALAALAAVAAAVACGTSPVWLRRSLRSRWWRRSSSRWRWRGWWRSRPRGSSRSRSREVIEVETEKVLIATPTPGSQRRVETEKVSVATSQSGPEASPSYGPRDRRDRGGRYDRGGADRSGEPYDATFFRDYGVNPFVDTYRDNMSTFAVDVDTASYTVARRFISDGFLPDPDSVRVEEFVNYFDQGYTPPANRAFSIHVDGAPSPFGDPGHWLLRVGLKGREISRAERKDATLVFVIDVSGSMNREDRLGLVKESLRVLVDELRVSDRVGIVAYGTSARVVMQPTSTRSRRAILRAIDSLSAGGSTNASGGLALGVPDGL